MPRIPDTYYIRRNARLVALYKPSHNRKTCLRKVRHETQEEARKVALAMCRKTDLPVTEYRCWTCGKWHCGRIPIPGDKR